VPFVAFSAQYEKVPGNQVGAVDQSMPAYQGGVREGDTIVAIDGAEVSTFWEIKQRVEDYDPERGVLALTVERPNASAPIEMTITPRAVQRHHPILGYASTDYLIGYQPAFLSANIAVLDPTGPAASAGLKTFDRVKTIDGKETPRYVDVVQTLGALKAGAQARLQVEREGEAVDARFEFLRKKQTVDLVFTAPPAEANQDLGIGQSGACITTVDPNGPAASLLKAGDCLISVNGVRQGLGAFLIRKLYDKRETAKTIEFIRDGQLISGELVQKSRIHMDPMAGEVTLWQMGFSLPRQTMVPPADVANVRRVEHGWYEATSQVPRVLKETLRTIGGMFSG
ncbi:MAG: PDZ domain-containing protein, partial [Roseibacillus sp.]|nr:PDZ domain-containing protein [Roseibacillus sp.]